jgi:hypothetical protein
MRRSPVTVFRSSATLSKEAPIGVLALFFACRALMRALAAAGSSGASGMSRSVWQELASRPNTRSAKESHVPGRRYCTNSVSSATLSYKVRASVLVA